MKPLSKELGTKSHGTSKSSLSIDVSTSKISSTQSSQGQAGLFIDIGSPLPLSLDSPIVSAKKSSKGPYTADDHLHHSLEISQESTGLNSFIDGSFGPVYNIKRTDHILGRGSSCTVFKSIMLESLVVCAEKVVVVVDPQKRIQIVRELKSLKMSCNAQDRCPYIVQLYDVIANPFDGTISVCLEYMDGGSLQDFMMAGGSTDEVIILGITQQLLLGLHYLHSHRIIHRDIKPSNALISCRGNVKLADFGLSRMLDAEQSLVESFVGTFNYMAPERMTGNQYSFLSDVWAFGLTVHAVAIGKYPYAVGNGTGYWQLLSAIQDTPTPLPPVPPYSQEFQHFIAKACAKDPAKRYTASDLLKHPFMTRGLTAGRKAKDVQSKQNRARRHTIDPSPTKHEQKHHGSHSRLQHQQNGQQLQSHTNSTPAVVGIPAGAGALSSSKVKEFAGALLRASQYSDSESEAGHVIPKGNSTSNVSGKHVADKDKSDKSKAKIDRVKLLPTPLPQLSGAKDQLTPRFDSSDETGSSPPQRRNHGTTSALSSENSTPLPSRTSSSRKNLDSSHSKKSSGRTAHLGADSDSELKLTTVHISAKDKLLPTLDLKSAKKMGTASTVNSPRNEFGGHSYVTSTEHQKESSSSKGQTSTSTSNIQGTAAQGVAGSSLSRARESARRTREARHETALKHDASMHNTPSAHSGKQKDREDLTPRRVRKVNSHLPSDLQFQYHANGHSNHGSNAAQASRSSKRPAPIVAEANGTSKQSAPIAAPEPEPMPVVIIQSIVHAWKMFIISAIELEANPTKDLVQLSKSKRDQFSRLSGVEFWNEPIAMTTAQSEPQFSLKSPHSSKVGVGILDKHGPGHRSVGFQPFRYDGTNSQDSAPLNSSPSVPLVTRMKALFSQDRIEQLARHLNCNETILRECFLAAIEDIRDKVTEVSLMQSKKLSTAYLRQNSGFGIGQDVLQRDLPKDVFDESVGSRQIPIAQALTSTDEAWSDGNHRFPVYDQTAAHGNSIAEEVDRLQKRQSSQAGQFDLRIYPTATESVNEREDVHISIDQQVQERYQQERSPVIPAVLTSSVDMASCLDAVLGELKKSNSKTSLMESRNSRSFKGNPQEIFGELKKTASKTSVDEILGELSKLSSTRAGFEGNEEEPLNKSNASINFKSTESGYDLEYSLTFDVSSSETSLVSSPDVCGVRESFDVPAEDEYVFDETDIPSVDNTIMEDLVPEESVDADSKCEANAVLARLHRSGSIGSVMSVDDTCLCIGDEDLVPVAAITDAAGYAEDMSDDCENLISSRGLGYAGGLNTSYLGAPVSGAVSAGTPATAPATGHVQASQISTLDDSYAQEDFEVEDSVIYPI